MIKRPVVIGLLVCEQVVVEERTRNLSLINCFTVRRLAKFPTLPQKLAAAAFLVDGLGDGDLDLSVLQLSTDKEIYHTRQRVTFADSLQEWRFVFRFGELVFPSPGGYEISLRVDQELLGQHAFKILSVEKPA